MEQLNDIQDVFLVRNLSNQIIHIRNLGKRDLRHPFGTVVRHPNIHNDATTY